MSYRIFAMNQSTINKVKRKLDDLCKDEMKKHVFDGPDEQKLIAKMTGDHVSLCLRCIYYLCLN